MRLRTARRSRVCSTALGRGTTPSTAVERRRLSRDCHTTPTRNRRRSRLGLGRKIGWLTRVRIPSRDRTRCCSGVRLCDERLADVTKFFSAWLPLLVIVVFWGWWLQRVLRRPTKPVLKWMVIGSVVVIALLFRNIYLALERRDRPVTADDLRIVTRTKALLQNDQVWNRNDDRECTDDESSGKRSLFCALQKATIEVLGEYDHRRVALQEVRFAIEDATRGQDFDHRLRDYNNLPQTKLSDIWRALDVATERMRARVPKQ